MQSDCIHNFLKTTNYKNKFVWTKKSIFHFDNSILRDKYNILNEWCCLLKWCSDLEGCGNLITSSLCISQKHVSVVPKENRVLKIRITLHFYFKKGGQNMQIFMILNFKNGFFIFLPPAIDRLQKMTLWHLQTSITGMPLTQNS